MSDYYELSYGEVLRELRIYHDYKQKDISDYLNITSQAYSNYETNKRTPDVDTIYKIAKFYDITVDKLISYRFTRQFADSRTYGTIFRGITDEGITIPLTAEQAKLVDELLSLTPEQFDAYQKLVSFIRAKNS